MLVADAGIGLVNALGGTAITFGEALEQAACTVPAVWLLVGLATAVIATRPTLRPLGGAGIVATFGITLLGPTFRFPDQAMSISPMGHVPNITADDAPWTGLLVVGGIAMAPARSRLRRFRATRRAMRPLGGATGAAQGVK